MTNSGDESGSEYSLLDFAAEFDGERGDEHKNAIEESEKSWDDTHGE